MTAKKSTSKKVQKTTTKKGTTKKSAVKKAPAKKSPARKTPAKKTATKKAPAKKAEAPGKAKAAAIREKLKSSGQENARPKNKPKNRPIAFRFEEAEEIAKTRQEETKATTRQDTPKASTKKTPVQTVAEENWKTEKKTHEAASLDDILGIGTSASRPPEKEVPRKFAKYHKLLLELRDHVMGELDLHSKETLKRSSKEDSGDLSSYSQHMADAGTDAFDRDFALNLLSSEQEALAEIEAAINRIHNGTYGVCEITGKPINKERLTAVPFTRYSLEGQAEFEKTKRRHHHRGGTFGELTSEAAQFLGEDADD